MKATPWVGGTALVLLLAAPVPADEAAEAVEKGNAALARQDFEQALAQFNKAIKIDPKNPSAYLARAVAYAMKGERTAALADYEKVLQLDPRNVQAYTYRGGLHLGGGDIDKALADFD